MYIFEKYIKREKHLSIYFIFMSNNYFTSILTRVKPFLNDMKKTITITVLISLVFFNCKHQSPIPENSRIDGKYIVFSPRISKTTLDSIKIENFKFESNKYPGFILNEKRYDIEYFFKLFNNGHLDYMTEYKDGDSYVYKNGIKKLPINNETIGITTLIHFSSNREYIIDKLDTLKIEKIFPKQKLILVGNDDDVRNYFYHYQ